MLNHAQGSHSDSQQGCELKNVYLSFLAFDKLGEKETLSGAISGFTLNN